MSTDLRIALIGPLPPPLGGIANQTRQLDRLLRAEGLVVRIVRTNSPYYPAWVGSVRGLRAVFRLLPYLIRLYREIARAQMVHVMANSGWAWHLFAAPALRVAAFHGKPVVVNYRGGLAAEFLATSARRITARLGHCSALVVPSRFLQSTFARYAIPAQVIPNVIDTATFAPADPSPPRRVRWPHVVVARNLEHLYGNDLAIRAVAKLRPRYPDIRLSIAGCGPERMALEALATSVGIAEAVQFTGGLETSEMAALYQSADVVVNPSRADNAPNSVLEALACGVPVVATDVGGVPFLVEHGVTAWLVARESVDDLAAGVAHVLEDRALCQSLVANGLQVARACSWEAVREQWLNLYQQVTRGTKISTPAGREAA